MDVPTYTAKVRGVRRLSEHLVRVSLGGLDGWSSSGVPDEYVGVCIPPRDEQRIYTIADHGVIDGDVRVDIDIALHEPGAGALWARSCRPGDAVVLAGDPRGMYAAVPETPALLLVADITGLPALARILRTLTPGQRADVVVVLTDPRDEIVLTSAADVAVTWEVVGGPDSIADALIAAVTSRDLSPGDPYVWMAGEARASRAARRHLRHDLGFAHSQFSTCGYWQVDAAAKSARYGEVADELEQRSAAARDQVADDEAAYLDALDDIYDSLGL